MKKRVRIYKRKDKMQGGGPVANNTQDSNIDPIPEERSKNFSSWLQKSAVMGAEREEQKKYEEFLKSMSKGGNTSAIPGYQRGGSMLSPGATLEDTTKNDTHLAYFEQAYNKSQDSNNGFFGNLGTLTGAAAGVFSQPDTYTYRGDTVNPFGEGVDMTGMDITGIEPGKNGRHRTMTYNATGEPTTSRTSGPGMTQEQVWNDTNITDDQYENFMGGNQNDAFSNAWYKMQQGTSEQMQEGGELPTADELEAQQFLVYQNWLQSNPEMFKAEQRRTGPPEKGGTTIPLENYYRNTDQYLSWAESNMVDPWIYTNPESRQKSFDFLSNQPKMQKGGQLRKAQNGLEPITDDCPEGYEKDAMGNCVPMMLTENGVNNGIEVNPQPEGTNWWDPIPGAPEAPALPAFSTADNPDNLSQDLTTQGTLDLQKQSKFKTFDQNNPYVKGEAIPAAMNAIAWMGEGDERNQSEQDLRQRISDPFNIYRTAGADRGDYMANVPGFGNELKPDDHTRWGRDTKVAQDGAEIQGGGMNMGDETEMSEEEIQRLLAQGYKLEFLD
jgi:hypothetical protein